MTGEPRKSTGSLRTVPSQAWRSIMTGSRNTARIPKDASSFDWPCDACKRRKVLCSKVWPCSNCKRNQVDCTYDSPRKKRKRRQRSIDLTERLARLESLVQTINRPADDDSSASNPLPESPETAPQRNAQQELEHSGLSKNNERRSGKMISENGRSRLVSDTFWATMYNEVWCGGITILLDTCLLTEGCR